MLFGWYDTGTGVAGAVSLTPPYELLLAEVPTDAVVSLARAVRELGVKLPGVHAEVVLAESSRRHGRKPRACRRASPCASGSTNCNRFARPRHRPDSHVKHAKEI